MMNRSLFSTLCLGALLVTLAAPAWAASLGDVISALETPFQTETDEKLRIYDYSADFFQESKIASLDRLQRASGEVEVAFDYQRTDTVPRVKFRWQYEQPTTQEIVSDAKTLWVYLPENNQVIQSDIEMVNRSRQNDPMTFLTGLGNLSRDFSIRWAAPNNDVEGNHVLELTPKRVSSLINKLIIVVDRYAVEAYLNPDQDEDQDASSAQSAPPVPTPPTSLLLDGFKNDPFASRGPWFPILSTTVYDPNGNSTTIEFSNLRVNFGISDMSFNFMMPAGVQVVRPTGQEMGF
ncbi:outer membrane lipoprotein carrier protein LolA [Deltaproteobacteria bacterium IMCC39524]|nr:outer membrane lipoprotein carrier protein LolA [Deltaproteobacteria bacterium IMCC39524]